MKNSSDHKKQESSIAIIGVGCFFPKASGLKEYWRLLYRGIDGITDVPPSHWSSEDYFHEDPKTPDHTYCKRGGFLSPISFDPSEFGIPPTALEATDTSQLFALVAAKAALEDSGYGEHGRTFDKDRTSVILGVTGTQELVIPLGARLGFPKWRKVLKESGIPREKSDELINKISSEYVEWQENSFPGLLGNVVAGRICNRLDLGGTNCVVDAACASSMSALHLAVMELSAGRSDMVITGGVDTLNDIFMHMCFSKTHTLSRTGDARPFSKDADGTVLGEGIGLIVLKRLEDAERENDRIYAVIKSIGASSDGKSQSIYSPSPEGQIRALERAYELADIDPVTVELIEAHGTGTRVGDMTEFLALNRFFGNAEDNMQKHALGSVKSMIGHTKSAAGAAGLIKSALALYHKVLPPTLKVEEPDPNLNIDESPFYINTDARPWIPSDEHPRRCGVSAFGFGGSNFHVVVEEYDSSKKEISWDGSVDIFALSAPTRQELIEKMLEHKHFIDHGPSLDEISALAFKTRNAFSFKDEHRLLLTLDLSSSDDRNSSKALPDLFLKAAELLETHTENHWHIPNAYYGGTDLYGKMAFLFPGQGSQYLYMGKDLINIFPEAMEALAGVNRSFSGAVRLSDAVFPPRSFSPEIVKHHEGLLKETRFAQPALGAVSMGMMKILNYFGIKPDATCGHSFGELTALLAAAWIDEETFIDLSIARGDLMAKAGCSENQPAGTMLAVRAPLNELEDLIYHSGIKVVLANRNSPEQGVVSGSRKTVRQFDAICRQKGYRTIGLSVSAAFHSNLVNDAYAPFLEYLHRASFHPSSVPVYSNTTGTAYPTHPDEIKELLARHVLEPVDFVKEIENMYHSGIRTFLEVGPKSVLTGLVNAILKDQPVHAVSLDASAGKKSGTADLAGALCHLASLGHAVDLTRWEHKPKPFRKQRMSIPICGANYRTERKPEIPVRKSIETEAKSDKEDNHKHLSDIQMNKTAVNDPQSVASALKTVQDTLKTIQALQLQTSETHKKFLDTQAENSRILKSLVDNARRITENFLGLQPADHSSQRDDVSLASPASAQSDISAVHSEAALFSPPVSENAPESRINPAEAKRPSPDASKTAIAKVMLDIVNRLTGYPPEMLDMDMDMESDLGIDSIKKVEILSALEENIPGLPQISPESIGALKTLGQIAEYLSTGIAGSALPVSGQNPIPLDNSNKTILSENTEFFDADQKKIETLLLDVVCRLTGYPQEMLGPDMDMESDLGIDSIKKVEILSALEENIPGLPRISPENIGTLKTLGQIMAYFSRASSESTLHAAKASNEIRTDVLEKTSDMLKHETMDSSLPLSRRIISVKEIPFRTHQLISIPEGYKIFVTEDNTGFSKSVVQSLAAKGIKTVSISMDRPIPDKTMEKAAGLIIIPNPETELSHTDLRHIFLLVKGFSSHLLETAEAHSALLAVVTQMDGAFGCMGKRIHHPEHGALAGLVKTAALEWENVFCRAIDIAPELPSDEASGGRIVNELLNADRSAPVEIGIAADSRVILELESVPPPTGDIHLNRGDVMVITGGARGITASCAFALARQASPVLVLFGRSPEPVPEPDWLSPLTEEAQIKKAILENEFSATKTSPVRLETVFRKHMANREINETLRKLEETGSTVKYYSLNILDKNSLTRALNEVRRLYGPITGVIHGAGILEDRLIVDKSAEQFKTVFETKVTGLNNLLETTAGDRLRYLILFSSIATRTGNKGQVDYAMANEVLNKIARRESLNRSDCKVVSINWGPWDGGMVSTSLKKEFQRRNIGLIPMDKGPAFMLNEMRDGGFDPVEVIIDAGYSLDREEIKDLPIASQQAKSATLPEEASLSLTFKREINVTSHPILNSHMLDGKPVLPLALISEWLGHGALHENPGLYLHGLDDMRVMKGIRLDQESRLIRLMAGKARKSGSFYEVDVELRDGMKGDVDVIHSRAKAILADTISEPPEFSFDRPEDQKPFPMDIEEIYDKVLFHGSGLRGIKEIAGYSSTGMTAKVSSAPSPANWMADPLRNKWISDPLVLDSAFQMATIWCHAEKGVVSLPSYSATYRQYRTTFPHGDITVVLEVTHTTNHKMKGNFTFLDETGKVIARIEGYEAVMDASLFKSFKPQYATA